MRKVNNRKLSNKQIEEFFQKHDRMLSRFIEIRQLAHEAGWFPMGYGMVSSFGRSEVQSADPGIWVNFYDPGTSDERNNQLYFPQWLLNAPDEEVRNYFSDLTIKNGLAITDVRDMLRHRKI